MTTRTPVPEQFRPVEAPATDRQLAYLLSLLFKKIIPNKGVYGEPGYATADFRKGDAERKANAGEYTKAQASKCIEYLLSLPDNQNSTMPPVGTGDLTKVEAGRYAVVHDGTLKFYRVDKPTDGRWAGYTFLKVQASDETYPIKGAMKAEVLKLIEAEPEEAMKRYGQELGHCGRCGRTLTDEDSRKFGIGPTCRSKNAL